MRTSTLLPAIVLLASSASASVFKRASTQYSTIIKTITTTGTTSVAFTYNQGFDAATVATIIPGTLTVTISNVPAYVYMETMTMTTGAITSVITTSTPIKAKSSSTTKASSISSPTSTIKTSSSAATTSSSPTSTVKTSSSAATTSSSTTKTTTKKTTSKTSSSAASSSTAECDNVTRFCGSERTCVSGSCYDLESDSNNCGSVGFQCDTANSWQCFEGSCVNVSNDTMNCGQTGYVCDTSGGRQGCVNGTCVGLSWDPNNCGTVGHVCTSGSCSNYKCVS